MKGLLHLSVSLTALALVGSPALASTYDNAIAALSPVAYFNMADSDATTTTSTNGYTLSLINGASVVAGTGPILNGASVPSLVLSNPTNANQQFATAGGSNPLTGQIGNAGTLVGWINLASLPSSQGRVYSLFGESTSGDDVDLQIDPDNQLRFYTTNGGGTQAPEAITAADLNKWIFVAASFTADGSRDVYVNGGQPSIGSAGGHYASNADFYIGQSNVFDDRYFDGSVADVAIYNKQLTTDQIDSLYAAASLPASAVPEPATWAMMIIGVGLVGGMMRRAYRKSEEDFTARVRAVANA